MAVTDTERRITVLEAQYGRVIEWVQEQKQMQKDRESQHRAQTRWIITLGVTILFGLAAIYFK